MAYGDPYCGNCHWWRTRIGQTNIWECDCTRSGRAADTSKDPNCHNSSHDHHDPESPIVLGQRAIDAADLVREEEAERRRAEVAEDEEETHCDIFGHVWVKYGRVGFTDHGLSVVDWGPETCMRCQEPRPEEPECWCERDEETGMRFDIVCPRHDGEFEVPEKGFVAREGPTDRPGGEFEGEAIEGVVIDEPKHECGGCNMRDTVIKEQKRLLADLVLQAPPSDVRREAERWLRLNGKIRAWGGD